MKLVICLLMLSSASLVVADTVVRDGQLTLSTGEVGFALARSPRQVRESALSNDASRYEFLVNLLVSKKILAQLEALEASEDPAVYYEFLFSQLEAARELDRVLFQNQLELPDFEALALERYKISKNDIASVPEIREASHILLLCTEDCDAEDETVADLTSIRQRILQGESFSDLAIEFSQDPGSKTRGGRLSQGIASDAEGVDQSVRDALFTMSQVGDISNIVRSRFGFHILKLESVTPARERSFEEVAFGLKKEIEKRFRQDAYREYILSLAPKEEIEIDIDAFEGLVDSI